MCRIIVAALLAAILAAAPAFPEMYKWQDQDGIWHYTNQKPPDDVPTFESESEIQYEGPGYSPSVYIPPSPKPPEITAQDGYLNPIAKVDRDKAREDAKAELSETYQGSYLTIKNLLDAEMDAYDKLVKIPSNRVNDRILKDLKKTYYPSFLTILSLYKSEIEAYQALKK